MPNDPTPAAPPADRTADVASDTPSDTASGSTARHRAIAERILRNLLAASGPRVSPDGRMVAFTVSRVDLDENTSTSHVWVAATDASSAPRPVTGGGHDGQPAWHPDGTALVFTSQRSGKATETTVHVMPMDGPGETRTVATMADGADGVTVSPDGRWIAFVSRTQHERYRATDERWQAPRRIDRFFSRLDDEGWIADRPAHVYVVPFDGSAPPRNLTPGEFQHADVSWLADSSGLLVSAQRHHTWDLDLATDLYRVGLDGAVEPLTSATGVYFDPSNSPDGGQVAFIGHDDPSTSPQNARIGIVDTAGGAHRWVSHGLDRTFDPTSGARPPVWESPTSLLAVAEDRGETHLYRLSTDGAAPQRVTHGALTVTGFDAARGTVAITATSVDEVADVFVVRGDHLQRLTDFGERFRRAVDPQHWERLAVPTADGSDVIDAWVMRPAGFDPDTRYPVLLNVHGGPHTQYGETMFDEAQFQAAAGFVVVMCNPRGSSGRHEAWGQAIAGPHHPTIPGSGWGSVDIDDVLAVLDHVLERFAFCDPRRVGMLGGSYGGFVATWLAARHGHRFRAICSERAVNNMLSEEWSSDIGSSFHTEIGPSYLDRPDEYRRISPVEHARDIEVPMLLIHSENDLRCPINQAEELFMALRLLGRDVTFYRFPGEGHELSRSGSPVHRRMRFEIIGDFFATHLQPG